MVENWWICDLLISSPKKFADLQFVDQSKEICGFEICGLAYLRNLRICDCRLSTRICRFADLKKHLRAHLCKFAIGVNDTSRKLLPLVSTTSAVNLPPVSNRWQIIGTI
jgi:hypothetical protein